jgi:hypothetical protein
MSMSLEWRVFDIMSLSYRVGSQTDSIMQWPGALDMESERHRQNSTSHTFWPWANYLISLNRSIIIEL